MNNIVIIFDLGKEEIRSRNFIEVMVGVVFVDIGVVWILIFFVIC